MKPCGRTFMLGLTVAAVAYSVGYRQAVKNCGEMLSKEAAYYLAVGDVVKRKMGL